MSLFHFLLALAVILAGSSARAAPLTLEQALQQAVQSYPALAAQQARMAAARYAAIPAAELPDPKLAFGIDNLPISGPDAFSLTRDFMTMQRIGISQEVPNADKRRARHDAAEARLAQAPDDADAQWLLLQALYGQIVRNNRGDRDRFTRAAEAYITAGGANALLATEWLKAVPAFF